MSQATQTLLIVDDSRTSRMLIRAMTAQSRPAWNIVEAAGAEEALAMIEAAQPHFVSMDMNMPGMNGLEAAGRIRIKYPEIRIVLCTANIQESVRGSAEKVGIHFVSKPITPQAVAQAIAYFES